MNGFALIFLFFVVIAITGAVFAGWVAYSVLRLIFCGITRLLGAPFRSDPAAISTAVDLIRCARAGCRAPNPATARFCRRCGGPLAAPQHVMVKRAAVW